MLKSLLGWIRLRLLKPYGIGENQGNSIVVRDSYVISRFESNPDNSYLVSFPRTGSHWLRMLMELYFQRPSLVRVFYYPDRTDYLTLHTHDLALDVERRNVIYLYRNPVETIYSQLKYHQEDNRDPERVTYWSDLYGRHLNKWLFDERFTTRKTILRYERMKQDLDKEFARVCTHFSEDFDLETFVKIVSFVSKQHVKERTTHDPQVVQLDQSYTEERIQFLNEMGDLVWNAILDKRQHLSEVFDKV